jgi:hypothetical protein
MLDKVKRHLTDSPKRKSVLEGHRVQTVPQRGHKPLRSQRDSPHRMKCQAEEAEAVEARMGILLEDRWGEVCWDVWFTASYRVAQRVAFHRDPTNRAFLSPALDLFVKLAQTNFVKAEMKLHPTYKREASNIVLQIVSHMPGTFRTKAAFPHHGASVASSIEGKLDEFSAQDSMDAMSMRSGSHQDSFSCASFQFEEKEMTDAEEGTTLDRTQWRTAQPPPHRERAREHRGQSGGCITRISGDH